MPEDGNSMDQGNHLTALVIEDDEEMAVTLLRLLRNRFSIKAEMAHDCATARRLMNERRFDLITLDYRLPDGAGLDLLDEITERDEHPPVIMVTGHGDEEIAARSFRSRASGYVVKDDSLPEMLKEAVDKAIAQSCLKKVERELLDEKVFVEHALNTLPDIFAVVNLDGDFFRWNSRLNEVTGYTDGEISSMKLRDLFRAEDGDSIDESMRRMRTGEIGIDHVTLKTGAGKEIPYELNGRLLVDLEGNPVGYCGIGRDVSDRNLSGGNRLRTHLGLEEMVKDSASELRAASDQLRSALEDTARAGEAMRSTERYYRSIMDNSIDVIAIFDGDGNMMEISPSVERVLGHPPSRVTGRVVFDIVHPDDAGTLRENHARLISEPGLSSMVECRFRHLDGTWRTFEVIGRSFLMEDGALRVVVNARDRTEAKLSEQKLLEREADMRALLNAPSDTALLIDRDGTVLAMNERGARALGTTPADIVGTRIYDHFEEKLREPRRLAVEKVFSTHEPSRIEDMQDGKWFDTSLFPVLDAEGNVDRVAVMAHDITVRKQAEIDLREREQRLRLITDNMQDVIAQVDLDGVFRYVSPSYETVLGYDPDDGLGHSALEYLEMIHPDDIDAFAGAFGSMMSSLEPTSLRYRYRHADGRYIWLDSVGVPLFDEAQEPAGAVFSSRDVTETVEAEEALRESESRYRSIFELSPDFIYIVDTEGRLVDGNRAMLERTGVTLEELRRANYMDFFAGDNLDELIETARRLRDGAEVKGFEVKARSARGEEYYYEINAAPLSEKGKLTGFLSLARDITERRRIEDELRDLNRELDGFAQTVSHDLRTPLTSIKLAADTLLRMWAKRDEIEDLGAEVERIAAVLSLSAEQAEALAGDLLELARAGQQPDEVIPVDISRVVEKVLEEREAIVAERRTAVDRDQDLGTVIANPTHMYQLFGNIIDNALRHNTSPDPRLEIRYLGETGGRHDYVIEDNGAGVPPEDRDNVFLPFFKGNSGSTGIGLAIVRKVVGLYQGSIRIAGEGSRFELGIRDLDRCPG